MWLEFNIIVVKKDGLDFDGLQSILTCKQRQKEREFENVSSVFALFGLDDLQFGNSVF